MLYRRLVALFISCIVISPILLGQKYKLVNIKQFPNDTAKFYDPHWSPNSKYIAMYGGDPKGLYIFNVDSASFRLISTKRVKIDIEWSLDSKFIAFGSDEGEVVGSPYRTDRFEALNIFSLNTGKSTEVARDPYLFGHCKWDEGNVLRLHLPGLETHSAYFDENGVRLSQDAVRKKEWIRPDLNMRLYRVNDDGTNKRYFIEAEGCRAPIMIINDTNFIARRNEYFLIFNLNTSKIDSFKFRGDFSSISRDGKLILYSSFVYGGHDGGALISSDIHIIESDGSNDSRLTFNPKKLYQLPHISPDNKYIVFQSEKTGKSYIATLKISKN